MSAAEQIAAAKADAQQRLDAAIASRAELHIQMQDLVKELNAKGVALDQDVISIQGELKALSALEVSGGE